jgi:uncharacterized protein (DUF736 family)
VSGRPGRPCAASRRGYPSVSSRSGVIKTLAFKIDAVFESIEKKSEKAPDYRVTTGNTDIGVASKKTSEAGNAYLSVQLC